MKKQLTFLLTLTICLTSLNSVVTGQQLERLSYNHPGMLVDLGVGLWAWPLPMDYNDNGLTDLVVVCTDTPYNGVYFFENTGDIEPETDLPVYKPAIRLGDAVNNASISYVSGEPVVTTPGRFYPDFKNTAFDNPVSLPAPDAHDIYPEDTRIRANQWKFVDYNNNDVQDLIVGIGIWGPNRDYRGRKYYGWDDSYDKNGQRTNGPLKGYFYLLENIGSNDNPVYRDSRQLLDTDGISINVYGRLSPNFADFTGDGKPDLICGEFRDGFTFFKNVGTLSNPLYAPGRPLTNGDKEIRMDLCMITPVAFDFTGNGWPDLVVGDEDGRIALVEHTGEVVDGMPLFLPPRYFRQQAEDIKFGALATPVGFDWNGNGLDDIIVGNTAGHIAFIENLGGNPVKWAAPELLKAGGEVIHIMAGPNGSIQGPAEAKWGYTTLTVADWNHNGLPDLIVNSIWGKVVWYENVGTRTKPKLAVAKPVEVLWDGDVPKPSWNWWYPEGNNLITQWRTTPVAVDWTGNGLTDLVMLDHEGYLALFRREKRNGGLILLPGERIFKLEGEEELLHLNDGWAERSGRRKIAIVDIDGDGRLDLLLNSQNASFYKNTGEVNGITIFRDKGLLDERRLAGHTSSPATIDLSGDGIPELLIGAEDGYLYYNKYIQHEIVYYEGGRFAAWPANGGMWAWDNEILVCFNVADHKDKQSHTYDGSTSRNMFARSLDGGETWIMEDAFQQGITGYAMNHEIGEKAIPPVGLEKPIDFHNPDFALMFQRETNSSGPTHFYFTYDRGKSWNGPYNFPDLDPAGITSRTDYIIDGKHEMLAFLSIGHGRTGVARTKDGGISWELLSYNGPDFTRYGELQGRNAFSLMPSTVRLSSSDILTTIRHREGDGRRVGITSYLSEDNTQTWNQLDDPVKDNINSPPALVHLDDGRLVLVYMFRRGGWEADPVTDEGSTVCVRMSSDNGLTWGEEIVLRGGEGSNYDVGYPRAVLRSDRKVVITYYWNHSLDNSKPPYRYIAATIWDPEGY